MAEMLTDRQTALKRIDLLALATVADVVDLTGENRTIVQLGLEKIRRNPHPAIWSLCEVRQQDYRTATSETLAFYLAPLINASNRIPRAPGVQNPALRLLLEHDAAASIDLRELLKERRFLQERVEKTIDLTLARQQGRMIHILTADSPDAFHEGIAGLIASTIVERTGKPALAIGQSKNKTLKGSGRSVAAYHLKHALDRQAAQLLGYGGHAPAAGFSLAVDQLPAFREAMFQDAERELRATPLQSVLQIAATVPCNTLAAILTKRREAFAEALERMGPFGKAREAPALLVPGVTVQKTQDTGPLGRHLRLDTNAGVMQAFFLGKPHERPTPGSLYDIVLTPSAAGTHIQLLVQSMRKHDALS